MNNQLDSLSQLMLPRLDEELRRIFKVSDGNPDPFYGMMQYHMGWVNEDFQPAALFQLINNKVPPATVVRALRRFDETCLSLTHGQYNDMDFETREVVQVDEYIEMTTGKTAALLSFCAELGAIIAGQDENSIAHYAEFGLNLGLAFQVIDDILGIWGDESKTGKSAATDIITKKKTLPVLYGLERSAALTGLYRHAEADDDFVREVVTLLDELGAREYASDRAVTYSADARKHLQDANPSGEAGEALLQLADLLMRRDY